MGEKKNEKPTDFFARLVALLGWSSLAFCALLAAWWMESMAFTIWIRETS
jgi:hypothetical protein